MLVSRNICHPRVLQTDISYLQPSYDKLVCHAVRKIMMVGGRNQQKILVCLSGHVWISFLLAR